MMIGPDAYKFLTNGREKRLRDIARIELGRELTKAKRKNRKKPKHMRARG